MRRRVIIFGSLLVVLVGLTFGPGHATDRAGSGVWMRWADPNGVGNQLEISESGGEIVLMLHVDCRWRSGDRPPCLDLVEISVPWWTARALAEDATAVWQATHRTLAGCEVTDERRSPSDEIRVGSEGEWAYLELAPACELVAPPDGLACHEPVTVWMDHRQVRELAHLATLMWPAAYAAVPCLPTPPELPEELPPPGKPGGGR